MRSAPYVLCMQTSRLQTLQTPNLVARDSYEETYGIGYLLGKGGM